MLGRDRAPYTHCINTHSLDDTHRLDTRANMLVIATQAQHLQLSVILCCYRNLPAMRKVKFHVLR